MSKFRDFMREVEAEARREGPRAVAELEAFDAHFRLAGELLALRKARRLTQRQLAEKTGVNQSDISRIEAGSANPTLSTIALLANALDAELSLGARKAGESAGKSRTGPAVAASTRRRATRATAAKQASAPRVSRAAGLTRAKDCSRRVS